MSESHGDFALSITMEAEIMGKLKVFGFHWRRLGESDGVSLRRKASITLTRYNKRGVDELFSCVETKRRRQGYLSP